MPKTMLNKGSVFTKGKFMRKLTKEEKQKILFVMNDFFSIYSLAESSESEYITEFDILMKKKEEEYKQLLLEDSDPSTIDALLELCEDYIKEKNDPTINGSTDFVLVMMYDMWINNSHVWPVKHNPEWEKWDKLKDKKVKRKNK